AGDGPSDDQIQHDIDDASATLPAPDAPGGNSADVAPPANVNSTAPDPWQTATDNWAPEERQDSTIAPDAVVTGVPEGSDADDQKRLDQIEQLLDAERFKRDTAMDAAKDMLDNVKKGADAAAVSDFLNISKSA